MNIACIIGRVSAIRVSLNDFAIRLLFRAVGSSVLGTTRRPSVLVASIFGRPAAVAVSGDGWLLLALWLRWGAPGTSLHGTAGGPARSGVTVFVRCESAVPRTGRSSCEGKGGDRRQDEEEAGFDGAHFLSSLAWFSVLVCLEFDFVREPSDRVEGGSYHLIILFARPQVNSDRRKVKSGHMICWKRISPESIPQCAISVIFQQFSTILV